MKRFALALLALALLPMIGCKSTWDKMYAPPEQFDVQTSRLNWLDVMYAKTERDSPVKIRLFDGGMVRAEWGTSELVQNQYAYKSEQANWNDRQVKTQTLTTEHFDATLQSLINAGLYRYEDAGEIEQRRKAGSLPKQKVFIRANINGHTLSKYTFNEFVIEEIEALVTQYTRQIPAIR